MTHAIRQVLVVLPLGLILSGCAGPQASDPFVGQASWPSARTASDAMVVDRSGSGSDEALASRSSEPSAADSQHYITLEQFGQYVQHNSAVVIDARSPEAFARGHVRGALNLPAAQVEANMAPTLDNVASSQLIIVYCSSSSCGASDMVAEYLAAHGYTNVRVFKPGWVMLASAGNLR